MLLWYLIIAVIHSLIIEIAYLYDANKEPLTDLYTPVEVHLSFAVWSIGWIVTDLLFLYWLIRDMTDS